MAPVGLWTGEASGEELDAGDHEPSESAVD